MQKVGTAMLKQKVVIKAAESDLFGQEGIIVAIKTFMKDLQKDNEKTVCKVLIGDNISDWIPDQCLER